MKFTQFNSVEKLLSRNPLPGAIFSDSMAETYSLYTSGLSVQKIAQQRRLALMTIVDHLCGCIKVGKPVKLTDLTVTKAVRKAIINVIRDASVNSDMRRFTPIKDSCPKETTHTQIRAVTAFVQVCDHLAQLNCNHEDFKNAMTESTDFEKEPDSDGEGQEMIEALNALVDEIDVDESFMNIQKIEHSSITAAANDNKVSATDVIEIKEDDEETTYKPKKQKIADALVDEIATGHFFMGPAKVNVIQKIEHSNNTAVANNNNKVNVTNVFGKKEVDEEMIYKRKKRKKAHASDDENEMDESFMGLAEVNVIQKFENSDVTAVANNNNSNKVNVTKVFGKKEDDEEMIYKPKKQKKDDVLVDEKEMDESFMGLAEVNVIRKFENSDVTVVANNNNNNKVNVTNVFGKKEDDEEMIYKPKKRKKTDALVDEIEEDESFMGLAEVNVIQKFENSDVTAVDNNNEVGEANVLVIKEGDEETTCGPKQLILHHSKRTNLNNDQEYSDNDYTKRYQASPDKYYLNEQGLYDATEDCRIFLTVVEEIEENCSVMMYAMFLSGSASSRMRANYKTHVLYGAGKHQSKNWWKCIGHALQRGNYLKSQKNCKKELTYSAMHMSEKGKEFLKNAIDNPDSAKILIEPSTEMLKMLERKLGRTSTSFTTRKKGNGADAKSVDILSKYPLPGVKFTDSMAETYTLYAAGFSVREIASQRKLALSTIAFHLSECIKLGKRVKLTDLTVTRSIKDKIVRVIRGPFINSDMARLKPIKERCPEEITYWQIRAVVAHLLVHDHLARLNCKNGHVKNAITIKTSDEEMKEELDVNNVTESNTSEKKEDYFVKMETIDIVSEPLEEKSKFDRSSIFATPLTFS